jgi:hypothetical protein
LSPHSSPCCCLPPGPQLLYLGEARRVVRERQAAVARAWRAAAAALDAAAASASFGGMQAALIDLESAVRRWEALGTVQAAAWIGGVTPQQVARLCVRAFPFAPVGDALPEHLLLAADAAAAALAGAARQ